MDKNNLFIDFENFDTENMCYVKPLSFYKVSKSMGIYYYDTKKKLKQKNSKRETSASESCIYEKKAIKKKIIVKSPKMSVPFGVKEYINNNKKFYKLCLSFNTLTNLYNDDEIKKFFSFIRKIDKVNEETVLEYKSEWGLPKKIKYKKSLRKASDDFPYYMEISLPYDQNLGFLFNTYDENAIKSNLEIIQQKSVVSVVLELTDLKFTDTEFRSNWTLIQIRKFKPYSPIQEFFMTACFISDIDNPEDTVYANLIKKYQETLKIPINLPKIPYLNESVSETRIPPPPPPVKTMSIFTPPSIDELNKAKKLLKKTVPIEIKKEKTVVKRKRN